MSVTCAYDGEEALELVKNNDFDVVLLDVMLPKLTGFEVCQQIREFSDVPIIMLTAKGDDMDKILGLEYGADDYITKPFNPLELIARVKSQIRRYASLGSIGKENHKIVTGGLVMDTQEKAVYVDGEEVKLTAREYKILELLMKNMNIVFTSSQIYEKVWNEISFGIEKTVTVHIRNIREKIEINPKEPKYLKVVYGLGYKIQKY